MSAILKAHIEKLLGCALPDYEGIERFFMPVTLRRKQNLLVEGKVCRANYFVVQGCSAQSPSGFYIQAVERTEALSLTFSAQEELLQAYPQLERYFRLVHQRAHAAYQFRLKTLYGNSREVLYNQFISRYPEFVQRIPQYLLASFLGFTPEYLSELRKRSVS